MAEEELDFDPAMLQAMLGQLASSDPEAQKFVRLSTATKPCSWTRCGPL